MAVNNLPRDEVERDPHIVRLLQAAGDDQPPAALDAAIQAAARRAVATRPQALEQGAGGSESPLPVARTKRNWYVPVSLAAVLVLSVSLVTLVHEEKGDDLAQPAPAAPASAPTATAPAPASAPAIETPAPAERAVAQTPVKVVPDEAPPSRKLLMYPSAKPETAEEKRSGVAPEVHTGDAYAKLRREQSEKQGALVDRAVIAKPVSPVPRREAADDRPVAEAQAPAVAGGGPASAAPSAAQEPAYIRERRPEPFAGSVEREAPVAPARDVARARNEANVGVRPGTSSSQSPSAAAPAPFTAAPRPVPQASPVPMPEEARARAAPAQAQGRVSAAPPPAAPDPRLQSKRADPPTVARSPWLLQLDNQPPEKWLELLATFKREGRVADAEELLIEFRRRFPEHPASAL